MYDPEYKVIRFVGTPMCTDTPTYEAWREEARRSPPGEAGFCMDCTPEYQQTMIAAERCEHPWVKFRLQGETDTTMVKTSVDDFWSKKLFSLSDRGIAGYIPTAIKMGQKPQRRFRF